MFDGIKEFAALVEERVIFGKHVVTLALYLALAVGVLALCAAAISFWKVITSVLPGSFPVPISTPEVFSAVLVVALLAFTFATFRRALRRIQEVQEHSNTRELRIKELEAELQAKPSDAPDSVDHKLKSYEDRIAYLESQVGDQLENQLFEQMMQQRGFKVGRIQRELQRVPRVPIADEERRLRQVQELLFEIVKTARDRANAGGDFEKLMRQSFVFRKIREFVTEYLSADQYIHFENFLDLLNARLEAVS